MLKKILLCSFILLNFAPSAWSGAIQVSQWIPWSFLSAEILQTPIAIESSVPAVNFHFGEFSPVASGVSVAVMGNLDQAQINHAGVDSLSDHMAAVITIQSLSINQYIHRNIGGNQINIHVVADCSPITIKVDQFSADISGQFVKVEDHWNLNLSALALSFPSGKWSVSDVSCRGVSGIDQDITNTIANNLKNPGTLQEFLKMQLAPVISQNWSTSWSNLVSSSKGTLSNVEMQEPQDLGLHITAEFPLTSSQMIPLPQIDDSSLSQTHPQLILSTLGFEALLQDKILASAPQKYNLQKIGAFSALMHNRITQFFVWPDLRRFSTNAVFALNTNTAASTLALKPSGNRKYSADLKGKGGVDVRKGVKTVTYLDWNIHLKADLTCNIKDSLLTLKTTTPNTQVSWNFNQNYLNNYSYNTRVSTSVMTNAIASAFTAQSTSVALPTLKWQGKNLKLQTWKQKENVITMDWIE